MGRKRGAVSKYDRQVIVQLGFDAIISDNAVSLNAGADIPSEIIEVHPGSGNGLAAFRYADVRKLTTAFAALTGLSRVYLQGHGDWVSQKLEDYDAEACALLLSSAKMPAVSVVSVLGCALARDAGAATTPDAAGTARVAVSVNSFAGKLHTALKARGIRTQVIARVFNVAIIPDGTKVTSSHDFTNAGVMAKKTESKVLFYWDGDTQMRIWSY